MRKLNDCGYLLRVKVRWNVNRERSFNMDMFCYQCQETMGSVGCNKRGVCGKTADVANLQDLLVYVLKGYAYLMQTARVKGVAVEGDDHFLLENIFATITNANFDKKAFEERIECAIGLRDKVKATVEAAGALKGVELPDEVTWKADVSEFDAKAATSGVGVLSTENEDVRSLRELLTYGIKGIAAYGKHSWNLGSTNADVIAFVEKGLAATLDDSLSAEELTALVLECGENGVGVMAMLDEANTKTYGHPEITEVNLGVGNKPGILVSGHDLHDMKELLEQTKGTGVDVYTHCEMLPTHAYPAFKSYDNLIGNYGDSWWHQKKDFETFNGPVLFTTNCIVPPKDSYKSRIYTTGAAGFDGCIHIADGKNGGAKDYSALIEHAKKCSPPTSIEDGKVVIGFAHNQVLALADKVVDAVKAGAIKRFFVMGGCDGRLKDRTYYTEFAEKLPKDAVILTAGCAKFRYNKLDLGDIGGIPRVLDAGQCNDSYSLAVIALKLKEVFGLEDINELPITYNIAWYEQKAVIVLLALLFLGVKNIHLGPTLPAFLSPNVAKVLIDNFGISGITTVEDDIEKFMG